MTKRKLVRKTVNTGTPWEEIAGFSRAIRVGNQILIAGTTASGPAGIVGKGDPAKQMYFILDRIEQAIQELGGTLKDVVRTRIYLSDINHWEIVAKIHGEKFTTIRPVNTLIEARLVGDYLVEVEAEAILDG
jgi:enamine deaminase RidA (YjgF/YER057c/UK114 family)